ncbi:MAG TPA: cation-translocating P-type ATPase [Flavitalea sp.]|nr:cation-translocating P-type ATPase [Flavitalea sp.]
MEKTNWKVEGMTCSNCSLTVMKYLEKEGNRNVKVNLLSGDVIFDKAENKDLDQVIKGIEELGYTVKSDKPHTAKKKKKLFSTHLQRFIFCGIFTLPLMLHSLDHWIHISWIMHPWVQFALSLPVYIVGMDFFGRSAIKSIRNGMPNMNVLVAIGATAAFIYSIAGVLLFSDTQYMFFETAAAIITLVFLGNYLEDASIESTQRSLNKLAKSQKVIANMIAFNDKYEEVIMPVDNESLRAGDLILIKSGEQVPADCKILSGSGSINESIITGESFPVEKEPKDKLIGGSILIDGIIKAQVTSEAKNSVLANIINLVKQAQGEKPPVQLLADRISAVFVPVVLVIAALTFVINLFVLQDDTFTRSLMRAIAVLVIACPCAMGLATPAAIAVGLGRAARNGILFRNAKSLELFKDIKQVVFDKTGTLTTGEFTIGKYHTTIPEEEFRTIVFSLEKYSNHPVAKSLTSKWKTNNEIKWARTEEIKGLGMKAESKNGDRYTAGSFKITEGITIDKSHSIYILKNDALIGWIDMHDEVRKEARAIIDYLKRKNIKPILLSGDRFEACKIVADQLGIEDVIAEQNPAQKLERISLLNASEPTAMVGDGINDAPALAKATIGISLSEASQVAMQTADVVLMDNGLKNMKLSLGLGKHTYMTIRQNLFWAFIYNILAIPVAAFGLLTPTFGALVMGLSDVVLAVNSVRLYVKKVD